MTTARKTAAASKSPGTKAGKGSAAAAVAPVKPPADSAEIYYGQQYNWAAMASLHARPACISATGGPTLIDLQKMRNNWSKIPLRSQIATCRRVGDLNWFVRGVSELRVPVVIDGFRLLPKPLAAPLPGQAMVTPGGPDPAVAEREGYDFDSLVSDIATEDFVSSNVVALWRKGAVNPVITILDAERVEYNSCGGVERIQFQCSHDRLMSQDQANKADYIASLGIKMYEACCRGASLTIIKGRDPDWDFEVMIGGKRRGCFIVPELVSILDDLDWLELMKVGDWNLANFRQKVLLLIKKGYAVTVGQGAGVNSVDMTTDERDALGDAFSKLSSSGTVPVNHDVNLGYLTIPAEAFEPKQLEAAIDRLLFWGGLEAVALFGSFSQQNGAAPSLMHNLRVRVLSKRKKIEGFLRRIFKAPEFENLAVPACDFDWSVKSLYSMEELLKLLSATADGTASPQTRRKWLDLDDAEESRRMADAHNRRTDYTPPFETRQGLVAPQFPDDFPGNVAAAPGAGPDDPGGRPADLPEA